MNDWQLFVTAGLPTVTVLLAMWRSDKRLDAMEKCLDGRIDGLEKRLDGRINGLEKRVDSLEARMDKRFDHLEGRVDHMVDSLNKVHLIFGRHDARLESLEKKQQ